MKTSKIIILVTIFFILTSFAFGADAVIKSSTGKVEIQGKGSSEWKSVAQGQKIEPGTVISTGFNSNAVLGLGDSEIFIKPLTRISVDELMAKGDVLKTDLNLKLGKVTADVKTTEGLKNDFTLRTPVSTAAVRGTKFTAGINTLSVERGKIAYSNNIGQTRTVSAGGSSSVGMPGSSGTAAPESAGEAAAQSFSVITSVSMDNSGSIVSKSKAVPTGKVIINWDIE
ncbi:MAG: FecR domain-containing protein [Spirochaetaceae bacterium]|nr:FecR domain-containing protein [Spirochaetaceae bacterium]